MFSPVQARSYSYEVGGAGIAIFDWKDLVRGLFWIFMNISWIVTV